MGCDNTILSRHIGKGTVSWGFSGCASDKEPTANAGGIETSVRYLGQEDPLKEGMATHSSILTWRIPWTEEPGGLQSIGSQRVGHDWSDFACTHAQLIGYISMFPIFLEHIKLNKVPQRERVAGMVNWYILVNQKQRLSGSNDCITNHFAGQDIYNSLLLSDITELLLIIDTLLNRNFDE